MTTPTNDPDPFGHGGTPAPPGQAPLPGQFGATGAPGQGYPAAPAQSLPTQTAPVYGGEQPESPYAPGGPGVPDQQIGPGTPGGAPGAGGMPGPGSMPPPYGYGYPPPRPTVTSAVAVVALCLFWVPLVGLVLSIIGMVKTARGKARGRGPAITALVLSILVTAAAGVAAAAIASKPSALDPGCTRGKSAVLEQSKQITKDSENNDTAAVRADLNTLISDLAKAAAASRRTDVRTAVQTVHDDYTAYAAGDGDQGKLTTDLGAMDHLCTIGK